jgi:glycosyltransferase involved in cell wall biosynthesis
VTVHDLSFLRTPQTVTQASLAYRTLVPRSIARAGAVIVPSAAVAAEVADEYPGTADRVVVTPLGVDPAWFEAAPPDEARRRRLGLPADYLVFSGSLEPRKNLPLLLAAHRRLRAEDPDWPPLVLMGPPGWGPGLDLDGLPPGAVRLTGYLSDDDLRSVVAGARALVYPSLYEGFGLPPLEAMAAGVPVVASAAGAVPEAVGDAAVLVPVGDADAFAAALAGLLDDESARARLAGRGLVRAAGFTWTKCAAGLADLYRRAGNR